MENEKKFILPPKSEDKIDLKTLVLDLDETLIHSQHFPFSSSKSDIVLKLDLETNEPHDFHVLIRPGAKEFIRKMNKFYEIIIFTASVSKYAIPLINLIDEKGLCSHRLCREHCSLVNTFFTKDLSKLGRDLKDTIIIDNSPLAYSLNKDNGIPIVSFYDDKTDRELFNLIPILEFLSSVPDVREFIPKLVINNEISYFASIDIMRKYKNENKNKKMTKSKTAIISLKNNDNKIPEKIDKINDNIKNDNLDKKDNKINNKIDNKIDSNIIIKEEKIEEKNKEKINENELKKESEFENKINLDINLSDLMNEMDDNEINNYNIEIKNKNSNADEGNIINNNRDVISTQKKENENENNIGEDINVENKDYKNNENNENNVVENKIGKNIENIQENKEEGNNIKVNQNENNNIPIIQNDIKENENKDLENKENYVK